MKRARRAELARKLEIIRQYTTGFEPGAGYNASRKMSGGKARAIDLYYDKIQSLLSRPHVEYTPKRGEKSEAFEYTGQRGYRKFRKAIVYAPDPEAELTFNIERERPRGSRFVPENRRTGQRYYHVPGNVFVDRDFLPQDFIDWLDDNGIDIDELEDAQVHELILRYFAGDAEIFLINASESYMWGAAGSHADVAAKINQILNNYGANLFNANDKNSSYYGNWFRGVTGFTNASDVVPDIGRAQQRQRERGERLHISPTRHVRRLANGNLVITENGELLQQYAPIRERE